MKELKEYWVGFASLVVSVPVKVHLSKKKTVRIREGQRQSRKTVYIIMAKSMDKSTQYTVLTQQIICEAKLIVRI